jgi:hypothetical protein
MPTQKCRISDSIGEWPLELAPGCGFVHSTNVGNDDVGRDGFFDSAPKQWSRSVLLYVLFTYGDVRFYACRIFLNDITVPVPFIFLKKCSTCSSCKSRIRQPLLIL